MIWSLCVTYIVNTDEPLSQFSVGVPVFKVVSCIHLVSLLPIFAESDNMFPVLTVYSKQMSFYPCALLVSLCSG